MSESILISARNISKSYGSARVLDDISFDVEKGVLLGIEGENGSGKSTLLNILARYRKADSGNLVIRGSTGFCPQEPMLFMNLTVGENIRFFSRAYGIRGRGEPGASSVRLDELFRVFNFSDPLSKMCSKLSGGTLQKLNLIVALLHDPDILFLDEPYSAFDWETYLAFWNYSDRLKEEGKTLVIISHILYAREKLDRIRTLKNGKLI